MRPAVIILLLLALLVNSAFGWETPRAGLALR